ncbi:MAG TPA: signal peptidase I [Dehalococcoidia bacterium]|nr:signal peptidase I [Dehalococcoidia bacterium]
MLRFLTLIAGLLILVPWAFTLRPGFLGGPAGYLIVAGHSMEPNLYTGDLVVTRQRDTYQIGEVVAYRTDEGIVIHRIVGGNGRDGFILQGDNKETIDPWTPTQSEIVGSQWLYAAGAGDFVLSLRQPFTFSLLIGGLALFLILGEVLKPPHPSSRAKRHSQGTVFLPVLPSGRFR